MNAKPYRAWDWLAAGLLIFAMFTASVRLDTTRWTPDLGYIEFVAVSGTVLGLALGLSHYKRTGIFWLTALYSVSMLPIHLSRIITGEDSASAQLASLGGRLSVSLGLLFSAKAITDPIFFVTLMALLFWGIGIYSGIKLMRGRAILPVLLPTTLVMLVIQYYDGFEPERIWNLGLYFFLALMLVGRINLLNSRERWEAQRIAAGSEPEFDLNQYIAVAAAVIIMAAWLLPAPNLILPQAASAWRSFNQNFDSLHTRLNDVLAALNANHVNNTAGELYGDVMGLGRTAGTGQSELFRVQAPTNELPRLYWRMRVYDTYENGSWKMDRSQNSTFDPQKGDLPVFDALSADVSSFTFTWDSDSSALLATPFDPQWTSRAGAVQTVLDTGGGGDPLTWSAKPALQNGDQYQVRARLSNPTQKQLRESGTTYPDWVTAHYLQVPGSIAPDYNALATQLANGLTNNYDKAEAVTAYLRRNITYSQSLPNPPPGKEPLDWFLFEWKSGFCDYYASAEVMLLRSLHIPARLAVGFAQGQASGNFTFSVKGLDAHAWPEVYFPGIGWVQFEPTVNQAELVRPLGEASNPSEHPHSGLDAGGFTPAHNEGDNSPSDPTGKITFLGFTLVGWLWIIICTALVLVLTALGWKIERQQSFGKRIPRAIHAVYRFYHLRSPNWVESWVRWSEVSAAERNFHAVNQALAWLGNPQTDAITSAERAMILKVLLPEASQDIDILSSSLESTLFTPHPADPSSATRAAWKLRLLTVQKIVRRWLYGAEK